MIEQSCYTDRLTGHSQTLWERLAIAIPNSRVVNMPSELPERLNVLLTLCPLYSPGSLDLSTLLQPPATIDDSRVAGKWNAVERLLTVVGEHAKLTEADTAVTVVFANKGVLLGHEPTVDDFFALEHHKDVYHHAIISLMEKHGLVYQFLDFADTGVRFDTFIDPQAPIPLPDSGDIFVASEQRAGSYGGILIDALNKFLEEHNIPTEITNNKKRRKLLNDLATSNFLTPESAFWLVAGNYLIFDYKIPQLIGKEGFYISTERFDPIHRIASLTPGLCDMTRIEIPA